jgi:spore maturation protein CgeB
VEAFGRGLPNGPATAEQSAEIFGRSRIILGVGNIAYNDDIFTLKLRDFDATMAGALYITHRNPDLLRLFEEGREIECYLTIDECIQKVRHYLAHREQRIRIAAAGAARARREHTWERRIATAFAAIGLVSNRSISV